MLKCLTCIHKKNIPGDAHVSCDRPSTGVVNANQHGSDIGWFFFPLNFDPCWAEDCTGYVSTSQKLEEKSKEELTKIFYEEFAQLEYFMGTHFTHVAKHLMPKLIKRLEKAHSSIKEKKIDTYSNEELIETIKLFQAV